jgi:SAM-dependent methyltransferase
MRYIWCMEDIVRSYSNLPLHRKIGDLIRAHSENKVDIRAVAYGAINWGGVRGLLDLGCGYGWFEEELKEGLDAIVGIDCLEENGAEFLRMAERVGKRATFKQVQLPAPIDMPPHSFDLVVAAYSIYFFPEMIPEAKRLLRPGGTLLIITHSESMLEEGERFFDFKNLRQVIKRFSAENGEGILRGFFTDITSVDYVNDLVFTDGDAESLDTYIVFKREFVSRDADPEEVRRKLLHELHERGTLRFNKNDRIFLVSK